MRNYIRLLTCAALLIGYAQAALGATRVSALPSTNTIQPGDSIVINSGAEGGSGTNQHTRTAAASNVLAQVAAATSNQYNGSLVGSVSASESNAVAVVTLTTPLDDTNTIYFMYAPAISDDATFYNITNGFWRWNSTRRAYTNANLSGYGVASNWTIAGSAAWIITNSAHHDTNAGSLDILAFGDLGSGTVFRGPTNGPTGVWLNDQFQTLGADGVGGAAPYMTGFTVTNITTTHYGKFYGDASSMGGIGDIGTNVVLQNAVPNAIRQLQYWRYVQDVFAISGSASLDSSKLVTPTLARMTNNQGTNFAIYYGSYTSANTGKVFAAFGNFTNGFQRYGPVLSPTPDTFDQGHVGGGRVFYEGGTNFFFYFGGTNLGEFGPEQIGLAWTTDGTNFTKYASNPILRTNAANPTLDSGTLYTLNVIKEGSLYYGFYNATSVQNPGGSSEKIYMVTAPALTGPWSRYSGNPVYDDPQSSAVGGITSDFSVFKITDGLWGSMYWTSESSIWNAKVAYSYDLTNWTSAGYVTNTADGGLVGSATGPFTFYYNGFHALITTNDRTLRLYKKDAAKDAFAASSLNYSWYPGQDSSENYWLGPVGPVLPAAREAMLYNALSNKWYFNAPVNGTFAGDGSGLTGVSPSGGTNISVSGGTVNFFGTVTNLQQRTVAATTNKVTTGPYRIVFADDIVAMEVQGSDQAVKFPVYGLQAAFFYGDGSGVTNMPATNLTTRAIYATNLNNG